MAAKRDKIKEADIKVKEAEKGDEKEKSSFLETIILFAVALVIALLLKNCVFRLYVIDGSSMAETMHDGDLVIVEKVSYYSNEPERFDVVMFDLPGDGEEETTKCLVKRIIGLPGETIQIKDGQIWIGTGDNLEVMVEGYGQGQVLDRAGIASEPITIGPDEYFVLGDNRSISKDSRNADVGLIKKETIYGKAWLRIWPLSDFGSMDKQ